jgi:hypothetical protein
MTPRSRPSVLLRHRLRSISRWFGGRREPAVGVLGKDNGGWVRRLFSAVIIIAVLVVGVSVPAAYAGKGNPSVTGTGPPGQSCQSIEAAGGTTPGHAASSPGSPFNEPGINSTNGGTGGQHYSESSQYDVACFHVS